MVGMDFKECFVGKDAIRRRGMLRMRKPVDQGEIDWRSMSRLYSHLYEDELSIDPTTRPVLIADPADSDPSNREKLATVFFEELNVPFLAVRTTSELAMYGNGILSGISLEVGHTLSLAAAVVTNGDIANQHPHLIRSSAHRHPFAGADLTEHYAQILGSRGYDMSTQAELEIVRDMKEKLLFVAKDFDEELLRQECQGGGAVSYELPDGSAIPLVGEERFKTTEILFGGGIRPEEEEEEGQGKGVQRLVVEAWKSLLESSSMTTSTDPMMMSQKLTVVVSGGTTKLPGFDARLAREIEILLKSNPSLPVVQVRVEGRKERSEAVFLGGKVLGSLMSVGRRRRSSFVSKEEYDEVGPQVILRMRKEE